MASDSRKYRPKARSAGLDIEELNDEIVVYDRTSDQVHLLSASTAKIWRLCDGKRRTVGIVDELEGQEASLIAVDSALSELEAVELLDLSHEAEASRAPVNLSRRSLLTHAAGASAFAAAIVTLSAPSMAEVTSIACGVASTGNQGVGNCLVECPYADAPTLPDPPATIECRATLESDWSCKTVNKVKVCETVGTSPPRPIDPSTCTTTPC